MEKFKNYKNKMFEYIPDAKVYGFKNPESNVIDEILIPKEIEKLDDLNITSFRSLINSGDYGFNKLISNVKVVYFEENSPIVEIPECFFSGSKENNTKGYNNLEKVFLPEKLRKIGKFAFRYTKIEEIDLPITLESIYANAFYITPLLKNHTDKDGVMAYIGDKTNEFKWALSCENCYVDEVVINEKTEFIAAHCFYYDQDCYNGKIKKITIPKSVKRIGENAFYGLKSLTDVIFEDGCNIDNISEGAFWWCNSLQNINIPKSVKTINEWAFALTKINEGHFENVEKIYEHAFTKAEFKNLYFGPNLNFIDKYTFDYLPRLDRNIYFDNDSAYEFYNGVVYNKKTSTAMFGIGTDYTNEIKIKDGTKIIADHFYEDAFTTWRKKTHNDASQWYNGNIIIPEGVETIGALAFYDCRISGLSLPSTLKKIGNSAFSGNYLKRLWLYNSITEIGEYAFLNSINDETEIHFQDNTFYDGKNFMINNTLIYTKQ